MLGPANACASQCTQIPPPHTGQRSKQVEEYPLPFRARQISRVWTSNHFQVLACLPAGLSQRQHCRYAHHAGDLRYVFVLLALPPSSSRAIVDTVAIIIIIIAVDLRFASLFAFNFEWQGRWLFRNPETHLRCNKFLERMMKMKTVKYLDNHLSNLLDNAFYFCKPPVQSLITKVQERTPLEQYIRFSHTHTVCLLWQHIVLFVPVYSGAELCCLTMQHKEIALRGPTQLDSWNGSHAHSKASMGSSLWKLRHRVSFQCTVGALCAVFLSCNLVQLENWWNAILLRRRCVSLTCTPCTRLPTFHMITSSSWPALSAESKRITSAT